MIRNKGFREPFAKKRGGEYPAFRDGLQWIAAEDCHACVSEFLGLIADVPDSVGDGDGEALEACFSENAGRISEIQARYVAAEDLPGELLKDYLKERKKRG